MYMDIHSHTYYSKCGKDDPHAVIDAAIAGGIEVFGLSDHNYGILDRKREYKEMVDALKKSMRAESSFFAASRLRRFPVITRSKTARLTIMTTALSRILTGIIRLWRATFCRSPGALRFRAVSRIPTFSASLEAPEEIPRYI